MRYEGRIVKASLFAGISELLLGYIFYLNGVGDWWFNNFHFFGYLGIGFILYAFWHQYFINWDNRKKVIKEFKIFRRKRKS